MSQTLATDQVPGSRESPPVYTAGEPLIWLYLRVPGRWFEERRQAPFAHEAVPIPPELYASLHKVSGLVAGRIAELDGLRQLSESDSQLGGLSGLLLYVTSLIFNIHHGMFPALSAELMGLYRAHHEASDGHHHTPLHPSCPNHPYHRRSNLVLDANGSLDDFFHSIVFRLGRNRSITHL